MSAVCMRMQRAVSFAWAGMRNAWNAGRVVYLWQRKREMCGDWRGWRMNVVLLILKGVCKFRDWRMDDAENRWHSWLETGSEIGSRVAIFIIWHERILIRVVWMVTWLNSWVCLKCRVWRSWFVFLKCILCLWEKRPVVWEVGGIGVEQWNKS